MHSLIKNIRRLALPGALAATALAGPIPAPKGDEAVFSIRPEVVVENPSRFGANIEPPALSHWNTEPWHNQWWLAPSVNPMTARHRGVASGGGDNHFDDDGDANGRGMRISFYDVFRDGFFDGGRAIVYRYDNGKMTLVRDGRIERYQASRSGPNRITFAEPGPALRAGDYYFLTVERMDVPSGTTRTWDDNPWWMHRGFSLEQGTEKDLHAAGVRVELSTDVAPGNGRASLKLTNPPGLQRTPRLGNWFLAGMQSDWPRLREGKPYTVRLWLKHEGMARPEVEVRIASLKTTTLRVTDQWKEYTIPFIGGPPGSGAERFDIGTRQAGSLFIDNVTIVQDDGPPPFAFYPEVVETLQRFRPSSLRLWTLQQNRGFGKRLDDALGPPAQSNLTFSETGGAVTTAQLGLHAELELCAAVGARPWIVTSVMFSPEENANLIEYLAGPADSPYGAKRAAWGRKEPWTEVFDQILIEPGNEVWNSLFLPGSFVGQPDQYGAYAEFIFQTMKGSRHFTEGKFQFIVNGWVADTGPRGYGGRALKNAPSAHAFDIAYYTGGWDAVGLMKSDSIEESWMNVLTYSRRMLLPRTLRAKDTADAMGRERGSPAQVLVYEAGPGYTLPGPGKFNREEQEQGKSLAHAINSLDIFMMNLRAGIGDQSFYTFKNGHYWASHNRAWGEHIAWKALGLRNSQLRGDLITAEVKKMVTIDLPETLADTVSQSNSANRRQRTFPAVPDMPLVDCYPFREGKRHSFMLLSRRIDGPTKVTLELPYEPQSAYTIHALRGDSPGLHNIDEEVVKVETFEREGMTRRHTLMLPPHSVLVLVNEAK